MILDQPGFAELARRHRRELHVHCYRMLASFDEAEDTVQETLLRAWRGRASFDGSTLARAWLYRIATNVCLDALRRRSRRLTSLSSFAEVQWLQPPTCCWTRPRRARISRRRSRSGRRPSSWRSWRPSSCCRRPQLVDDRQVLLDLGRPGGHLGAPPRVTKPRRCVRLPEAHRPQWCLRCR